MFDFDYDKFRTEINEIVAQNLSVYHTAVRNSQRLLANSTPAHTEYLYVLKNTLCLRPFSEFNMVRLRSDGTIEFTNHAHDGDIYIWNEAKYSIREDYRDELWNTDLLRIWLSDIREAEVDLSGYWLNQMLAQENFDWRAFWHTWLTQYVCNWVEHKIPVNATHVFTTGEQLAFVRADGTVAATGISTPSELKVVQVAGDDDGDGDGMTVLDDLNLPKHWYGWPKLIRPWCKAKAADYRAHVKQNVEGFAVAKNGAIFEQVKGAAPLVMDETNNKWVSSDGKLLICVGQVDVPEGMDWQQSYCPITDLD